MAKSAGNINRVADLLAAGVSPRALRYALIAVQYRQGLDYTDASLEAATAAIGRLDAALLALASYTETASDDATLPAMLDASRAGFEAALDDDLNVSAALASLFDLVREANRRIADRRLSTADAGRIAALLRELDRVLGILPDPTEELPAEAAGRLEAREAARAAHDWGASDRLRDELAELGVLVEDTRDGQRWRLVERVP
jgi:cysteinyl-tRNA synthetase